MIGRMETHPPHGRRSAIAERVLDSLKLTIIPSAVIAIACWDVQNSITLFTAI